MPMTNRFVLSGGPGGGKSALLAALAERGYPVVPESARAIIRSRLQSGLAPRPEPAAFAQTIFEQDTQHYQQLQTVDTPCFFDRSVVDALYMLHAAGAMDEAAVATTAPCSFCRHGRPSTKRTASETKPLAKPNACMQTSNAGTCVGVMTW